MDSGIVTFLRVNVVLTMLLVDSDENVSVGDREFGDDNGDGSDAYEPEGMVPTR